MMGERNKLLRRIPRSRRIPPRRGVIFILALAVIVILSGLALVFARDMRTEALASANRLSEVQADAIEQGAEQWVLAQVESYAGDAVTLTQTPAEAIQLGNGYFWLLSFDPTQDQNYTFGIVDEQGKLNLNSSQGATFNLINLPNLNGDQTIVDSISNWITPTNQQQADGATDSYYESLTEPYQTKQAPFETVGELMMVKDITPQVMFGYDLNRDGVIDQAEQSVGGFGSSFNNNNGTTDSRGLFNYITVYSKAATTATGAGGAGGRTTGGAGGSGGSGGGSASTIPINANTASAQVISCIPGITFSEAQSIVNARTGADTTPTGSVPAWFSSAVQTNAPQARINGLVTGQSFVYSADIVAVSADGRAFKRVRIVVDASDYSTGGSSTPAKIVYRRDLTALGWPLPPEIRTAMRSGQAPPDFNNGLGSSGGGLMGNLGLNQNNR